MYSISSGPLVSISTCNSSETKKLQRTHPVESDVALFPGLGTRLTVMMIDLVFLHSQADILAAETL